MQVWLMAASSKGFILGRDHVNLVLTIVQQASSSQLVHVEAALLLADCRCASAGQQLCRVG
jgi:hypothetical protein